MVDLFHVHALYPPHEMDWREIMSWNSIDGILLAKSILQLGSFGMDSDGGLRWYHNPQVRRLRWPWDPGESIGDRIGRRIVWDPNESIKGRVGQRIVWDPGIEGSIHFHVAWRYGIAHWAVWDPGINAYVVDSSKLLEGNQSLGRRICNIPFLHLVKMDRIYPWYLPWYFPMVSTHGICFQISRENNKIGSLESLSNL